MIFSSLGSAAIAAARAAYFDPWKMTDEDAAIFRKRVPIMADASYCCADARDFQVMRHEFKRVERLDAEVASR